MKVMAEQSSMTQSHLDYQLWKNELMFFSEEIQIFQKHLVIMRDRDKGGKAAPKLSFYEGQFTRQQDLIEGLLAEISVREKELAISARATESGDPDAVSTGNDTSLADGVESFRRTYLQTKNDFRAFEAGKI
jgi:hypothetical protein